MKARYGASFMTRPRRWLVVRGHAKAESCLRVVQDALDGSDVYPCSLLGLVNALPCRFGWRRLACVTSEVDENGDRYVLGWRVIRKMASDA